MNNLNSNKKIIFFFLIFVFILMFYICFCVCFLWVAFESTYWCAMDLFKRVHHFVTMAIGIEFLNLVLYFTLLLFSCL